MQPRYNSLDSGLPLRSPERRPIAVALQGGGSHGAFTWGVIDRLLAAGANIGVPGNGGNETYLGMAEGNDEVQQALRRHGARA